MKINKLVITVISILLSVVSFAQEYIVQVRPMDSKNWGYININGDYILTPQFRKCFSFSENGYAIIYEKKEGYYFINTKGEVLQTEISDYHLIEAFGFGVQGFSNGFVPVFVDNGWGYMNTKGQLAVPAKYAKVSTFKNGFGVAQTEDNFYIIDKEANEIHVAVQNVREIKWFSENLAPFKNIDGLYGFINAKGEIAIEARFLSVGYFNAGLAWAKNNDGLIGFINANDEWIIQPQYRKANDFDPITKMARVIIDDEWVYVNTSGEISTFTDSEYISEFHDGLAKGKKNDKLGFFNSNLEWVIEPQFDGVRNFKNGFAAVKVDNKWGIIDTQGNWIIHPTYAAIKDVVKLN